MQRLKNKDRPSYENYKIWKTLIVAGMVYYDIQVDVIYWHRYFSKTKYEVFDRLNSIYLLNN